nr:MAG TPA: hypothetical protein [Caudoviricetes sp.]
MFVRAASKVIFIILIHLLDGFMINEFIRFVNDKNDFLRFLQSIHLVFNVFIRYNI